MAILLVLSRHGALLVFVLFHCIPGERESLQFLRKSVKVQGRFEAASFFKIPGKFSKFFPDFARRSVNDGVIFCVMKGGDAKLNPRFTHSMTTELHDAVKNLAKTKGLSVTGLINEVMADYAGVSDDPGFITELRARIEKLEKEVETLKKRK